MATKAIYYTSDTDYAGELAPYLKRIGVEVSISPEFADGIIQIVTTNPSMEREQDRKYLVGLIENILKSVPNIRRVKK
jgi:hypothetical protein